MSDSGSSSGLSSFTSPPSTPPTLHQNTTDPSAKWLVQKYGGTSVGKFAVQIAKDIVSSYIDQHKVAIVCSARSGSTKALGTTNLLLRAAAEAKQRPPTKTSSRSGTMTPLNNMFGRPSEVPSPRTRSSSSPRSASPSTTAFSLTPLTTPQTGQTFPEFNATVDLIRAEHLAAAKASVETPEILQELEAEIERDCDWLRSFLFAAQVIDEISPRSRDSIVGFGERLGCKLITAILRDQGIDAEYVSLEDVIPVTDDGDSGYVEGALDQSFYDSVAAAVWGALPVVTGFFGPVPGSLLRQVGRGYTDLLSALLAVGLGASELQIWKEVDGIFTADPRKVPTARLIPIISPDEAAELTYYGSEVVHPFTMEQVIRRKIPIRIKNVENASDAHRSKRLPTAVTIKERIVVLNVNSNRKSVSHGFLARIFGTLDRFGVVVDLISTSEVHVSMAIEDSLSSKIMGRLVSELQKSGTVSVHPEMAILSLVGKQMRNLVGISGRMFQTLAQGNVNIEMISQGASEINISCVIQARDAMKALNLIHQGCLQIKPEGVHGRVGPWLF
ncbi:Aspartate/glutamate/uridylate kinase [Melanogaster broomeanus]|nr:Aspartate/glutamate/uridylate kinase [Melanogaster broomeanus]